MSAAKPAKRPTKPKRQGKASKRAKRESLPDLHAILGALHDGTALVSVAHTALEAGGDYGPEEYVLRRGVEALDRVYDQLDEAVRRVERVAEAHGIPVAEAHGTPQQEED